MTTTTTTINNTTFTSAGTSVNAAKPAAIVSKLEKIFLNIEEVTFFDFGCGKYFKTGESVKKLGANYVPFDPYNMPKMTNEWALDLLEGGKVTLAMCNNVLNVIPDRNGNLPNYQDTLKELVNITKQTTAKMVLVTVYEGDKSGKGKPSKRKGCWQRNQKLASYVEDLKKVFREVKVKFGVIICKL